MKMGVLLAQKKEERKNEVRAKGNRSRDKDWNRYLYKIEVNFSRLVFLKKGDILFIQDSDAKKSFRVDLKDKQLRNDVSLYLSMHPEI